MRSPRLDTTPSRASLSQAATATPGVAPPSLRLTAATLTLATAATLTRAAAALTVATAAFLGSALLPSPLAAQNGSGYGGIRELAPGVLATVAPEGTPSYLFANSLIVIGEDGVLVVDSGQRPAVARELVALIRERTDRPVRWVVNTHWHGDHVWGNAVFRDAFPGVRILATPSARDSIAAASERQVVEQIQQHRQARSRLAAMMDTADADLQARIRAADSLRVERIQELHTLEIVLPDDTFDSRTTLDLGDRSAVLLPLGPAHTPGDAAVWLPDSRTLAVGDLLEEGDLWLDGADIHRWIAALDTLHDLDPRFVVPAHGNVDEHGALLEEGRRQLREAGGGG